VGRDCVRLMPGNRMPDIEKRPTMTLGHGIPRSTRRIRVSCGSAVPDLAG
jgi:hypothetical protein